MASVYFRRQRLLPQKWLRTRLLLHQVLLLKVGHMCTHEAGQSWSRLYSLRFLSHTPRHTLWPHWHAAFLYDKPLISQSAHSLLLAVCGDKVSNRSVQYGKNVITQFFFMAGSWSRFCHDSLVFHIFWEYFISYGKCSARTFVYKHMVGLCLAPGSLK